MPHADEVETLRRRSKAFLERAKESIKTKDYDIAVFLAEQAMQLYLKSILLEEVGDYPRTHSITTLVKLIKRMGRYGWLIEEVERRVIDVRFMEDAYIAARYLASEYGEEESRVIVGFVEGVLRRGLVL